eukprot:6134775-Pyramimonas_sp.AAC.1
MKKLYGGEVEARITAGSSLHAKFLAMPCPPHTPLVAPPGGQSGGGSSRNMDTPGWPKYLAQTCTSQQSCKIRMDSLIDHL